MEDAIDVTTVTIATNITVTPTSPISSADQRLPSRAARRRCSGYSITARIADQSRRSLKGDMNRLQAIDQKAYQSDLKRTSRMVEREGA